MDTELATLSDEELDALRVRVLSEQERRADLATIPTQILTLAEQYRAGGGDPALLTLTPPEGNAQ